MSARVLRLAPSSERPACRVDGAPSLLAEARADLAALSPGAMRYCAEMIRLARQAEAGGARIHCAPTPAASSFLAKKLARLERARHPDVGLVEAVIDRLLVKGGD